MRLREGVWVRFPSVLLTFPGVGVGLVVEECVGVGGIGSVGVMLRVPHAVALNVCVSLPVTD
jgi:hypothetical protein